MFSLALAVYLDFLTGIVFFRVVVAGGHCLFGTFVWGRCFDGRLAGGHCTGDSFVWLHCLDESSAGGTLLGRFSRGTLLWWCFGRVTLLTRLCRGTLL